MSNAYEKLSFKKATTKRWTSSLLVHNSWLPVSYRKTLPRHGRNTKRYVHTRIAKRAKAELTTIRIPAQFGYSSWFDAYFDVMWKGWLSPSTPVLSNMGNERGHPIACSGTHLGDSISSFYSARKEIAQLTQRGYGTSWCLDPVRHRGAPISKGGTANGVMQPASGAVQDTREVSQGGVRRGSIGQYLNILHPDFDEVCDQLISDHDGWNIGWNFTEEFKHLYRTDQDRADHASGNVFYVPK